MKQETVISKKDIHPHLKPHLRDEEVYVSAKLMETIESNLNEIVKKAPGSYAAYVADVTLRAIASQPKSEVIEALVKLPEIENAMFTRQRCVDATVELKA